MSYVEIPPFLHLSLKRKCPLPKVTSPELLPLSRWLGTVWHGRDLCPRVKQLFWALANRSDGLTKSVNRGTTSPPHIPTTPAFSSPFSRSHGTLPCMEGHEGWHTCEHMALPSWGKCTQKHMVLPSSSSANTGRLCQGYIAYFSIWLKLSMKMDNLHSFCFRVLSTYE